MKSSPECCSPISVNFHFVHIDTWWLATAKYAPLLALLYTDQTKIYLSEGFIFTKIKATIKVNALFFYVSSVCFDTLKCFIQFHFEFLLISLSMCRLGTRGNLSKFSKRPNSAELWRGGFVPAIQSQNQQPLKHSTSHRKRILS